MTAIKTVACFALIVTVNYGLLVLGYYIDIPILSAIGMVTVGTGIAWAVYMLANNDWPEV